MLSLAFTVPVSVTLRNRPLMDRLPKGRYSAFVNAGSEHVAAGSLTTSACAASNEVIGCIAAVSPSGCAVIWSCGIGKIPPVTPESALRDPQLPEADKEAAHPRDERSAAKSQSGTIPMQSRMLPHLLETVAWGAGPSGSARRYSSSGDAPRWHRGVARS